MPQSGIEVGFQDCSLAAGRQGWACWWDAQVTLRGLQEGWWLEQDPSLCILGLVSLGSVLRRRNLPSVEKFRARV